MLSLRKIGVMCKNSFSPMCLSLCVCVHMHIYLCMIGSLEVFDCMSLAGYGEWEEELSLWDW